MNPNNGGGLARLAITVFVAGVDHFKVRLKSALPLKSCDVSYCVLIFRNMIARNLVDMRCETFIPKRLQLVLYLIERMHNQRWAYL